MLPDPEGREGDRREYLPRVGVEELSLHSRREVFKNRQEGPVVKQSDG